MILIGTIRPELGGDGDSRLKIVEGLLAAGHFIPSKYSVVQPILSLPLVWVGRFFGYEPHVALGYFNTCVLVVLGQYVFRKIAEYKGLDFAAKVSIFALACSMLHVNLAFYYGEVLTAFGLLAGFLGLSSSPVFSSILIALSVANTPVMGVPVLVGALMYRKRLFYVLSGLAGAALIFCLETTLKYGSFFDSGYFSHAEKGLTTILPYSGKPGFSYPFFFGVVSILFSFGKGVFFYIPSMTLAFRRSLCESGVLQDNKWLLGALGFFVAHVAVYAKWWAWYGGVFWGPRFFLIHVALGAVLFVDRLRLPMDKWTKVLLGTVLVYSTWVGIAAVVFRQFEIVPICEADGYRLESLCWYVPEFSPLWLPFVKFSPTEILHQLAHRHYHSFVAWQLLVCAYFMRTIYLAPNFLPSHHCNEL